MRSKLRPLFPYNHLSFTITLGWGMMHLFQNLQSLIHQTFLRTPTAPDTAVETPELPTLELQVDERAWGG